MSRSSFKFKYESAEKSQTVINNILISNGFSKAIEQNEMVWTKGNALLTGKRYIKIEFGNDEIIVSGWVNNGLTELDLTGFSGSFAKGQILKIIEQIKLSIT